MEGCSFVKSVTSQEVLALLKTESRLRRELIRAGLGDCLQAQFTTAAVACSRWAADNGKKIFSGLFFFFFGEIMLCRICVLMPQPPKGWSSSCVPSPVGKEADTGRTLGMFQMLPDGGLTPHSESLWLL